jgi:predicted aspartyl protease
VRAETTFRMAGGDNPLIITPVRVNGRGPYDFIVDTGAGTSLLDPDLARCLGIQPKETRHGAGIAGPVTVSLAQVDSLEMGLARREQMTVALTEELKRIGAAIGARVDGNVGYDFLSRYRLTLDYRANRLTLESADETPEETPDRGISASASIDFTLAHPAKPLILLPVKVNGRGPYPFVLDTGASATVLEPALAAELGITLKPSEAVTGAGGTMETMAGEASSVEVAGARQETVGVISADFLAMLSRITGAAMRGVLGYNFLRPYVVTIDYPASMLVLKSAT